MTTDPSHTRHGALTFDTIPETDIPHVRYTSGLFIYDEVFLNGRLISRYWSATGGIRPDMHFRWGKWYTDVAPSLPADAFALSLEGQDLRHGWRWVGAEETPDPSGFRDDGRPVRHAVIRLAHEQCPVDVGVHTRIDGSPFVIRWLDITNRSDRPTAISAVSPWSGLVWMHRAAEHTPSDASGPFEVAYTHHFRWGEEGDLWWEPLPAGTKTIDGGRQGRSGWGRPAFLARNRANGETVWVELGWSGNWRIVLACGKDDRKGEASLTFSIGPDASDQALRVLDPGETVSTPAVHLALFHADLDACVHAAHDHVRHVVMPAQVSGRHQRIEANHRGYICDRETEEGIKREIDIAAAIGAELFVVDAGWYGPEPNTWWNNVGDWHAGRWLPNGLEPVVAYAHERGLLFGLWAEIEAIGQATRLRQEHPDWVLTRDGQPVGSGRVLDLTKPDVVAWMESEIVRLIRQYNLDLFRLDYNTAVGEGGNRVYQGFVENTLWRHCEALYRLFDHARAQCPGIIFENCAGGGGRLDWEVLRRFQITEISDWMRAPRGLKILNGVTFALPPEVCLRTFGTETGEHVLEGDLDFQLRVVLLSHPIFRGISPTIDELNPVYRARIVHAVELYKRFIRPLLPDCQVFHHTGMLPLFEQTPWCVLEYAAADRSRAVIGLFRTADIGNDMYVVRPAGLDRSREYRVTFDTTGETTVCPGFALARHGIRVRLSTMLTSELLLIEVE
ncbi:MAG: alpha-galactosidase [Candidatus Latescibacteria bacterium]|nr:alpha-galactosidase [Candidatus Latescibacterota bacterium]